MKEQAIIRKNETTQALAIDDDDDDSYCGRYCESIRSSTGLEIGCRVTWPGIDNAQLELSTCLPATSLAPMFDGSAWAGTRLWRAAVVALQYLLQDDDDDDENDAASSRIRLDASSTLLELGCGLGVPGMLLHQRTGCRTVLTDKDELAPQLQSNLEANNLTNTTDSSSSSSITAHGLDWSTEGVRELLETTGLSDGFDVVLNCDCIYEPLYGESWKMLLACQVELLRCNPHTIFLTSCERRRVDGVDKYLVAAAKHGSLVVEKVIPSFDYPKEIELYRMYGRRTTY